METKILQLKNISKYFFEKKGILNKTIDTIYSVNDITHDIIRGETFSLVGESGSGKTTLGKTAMRIYHPTSGKIIFDGDDISSIAGKKLRTYRKHMQMVFQDPASSLNPKKTIGESISLPLKLFNSHDKKEINLAVGQLLESVELPTDFRHRYPHTLSGGQKQRVCIARAISLNPKLMVLDEPTSALDVSVQAKILQILTRLQKEYNITYLYITHDLSVAVSISSRIGVMYLGEIMEVAPTEKILKNPQHPYTKALFSAIPVINDDEKALLPKEVILSGTVPSLKDKPEGCNFYSRCPERQDLCQKIKPSIFIVENERHFVKCHLSSGTIKSPRKAK